MALFVIAYDLVKENTAFDYQPLWDALDEPGAQKTQRSVRFLDRANTTSEIFEYLRQFVDQNDRRMVVEFDQKPEHTVGLRGTRAWIEARFN